MVSHTGKNIPHKKFGQLLVVFCLYDTRSNIQLRSEIWAHSLNDAVDHLYKILGYQDRYAIQDWLKGYLLGRDGKKPLSNKNMQALIVRWLGVIPGLQTEMDVAYFLSLGPEKYDKILQTPEYINVCRKREIPPAPLSEWWAEEFRFQFLIPHPSVARIPRLPREFVPREDVCRTIMDEKIPVCKEHQRPLILYGPPGAGKTTLMSWLGHQKDFMQRYDKFVWIAGFRKSTVAEWLKMLQVHLLPEEAWLFNTPEVMFAQLRRSISKRKQLLMLDDCWEPKLLRRLPEILGPHSLAIITTRVASGLHKTAPSYTSYQVPLFESQKTLKYYMENHDPLLSEEMKLQLVALSEELGHDLLGVRIVLQLASASKTDLPTILEQLRKLPRKAPPNLELGDGLYRAMVLAYQTLPPKLQKAFRALGGLPHLQEYAHFVFQALWNVPAKEARNHLAAIEKATSCLEFSPNGRDEISIPAEIHKYAHHLLVADPEEYQYALAWIERAQRYPTVQKHIKLVWQYRSHPDRPTIWQHTLNRSNERIQHRVQMYFSGSIRHESTSNKADASQFGSCTLLSTELHYLRAEEYLVLLKVENGSLLNSKVFKLANLKFPVSATVLIIGIMLLGLIFPTQAHVFRTIAENVNDVSLFIWTILSLLLACSMITDAPRYNTIHYLISERLKQQKTCSY